MKSFILVYTNTVDSVKRVLWLARQTPNILCYLPQSNSGKMAARFASVTSEEIIQIICGAFYLTVLVYTKTTIHLSDVGWCLIFTSPPRGSVNIHH